MQCLCWPLVDPVKIRFLQYGRIRYEVFLKISYDWIKKHDDMEMIIQEIDEEFNCILFIDCLMCPDELVLKKISKFFVVSFRVDMRQERRFN